MKARSVLFAVLATGVVAVASGCSGGSSTQAGSTSTTVAVATTAPAQGGQSIPPTTQVSGGQGGGSASDSNTPGGGDNSPQPAPVTTTAGGDAPQPTAAPVTTSNPAPNGSGHGLCFDLNSALANQAIKSLGPTANGGWSNPSASNDPISAGCDGVLSWMTVESGNIHPYIHVLFFANGSYLGTATSKPYGYTTVTGKTADTVTVQYKWAKPDDALCCPSGGPSTVTFTLSGGKVQAKGQFPPGN
ncbi:LppP/LprE family lipoprotein [Nocardia terrae]|nr:LppP/LprE family lipoprotein [Nocardia terrae]